MALYRNLQHHDDGHRQLSCSLAATVKSLQKNQPTGQFSTALS
jgi:hypothetical protein